MALRRVGLVVLLAAVLVLLAVLQYRWSLEVSRAERTRIETSLNNSVNQFRQEFYRELTQVSTTFHNDPMAEPEDFWTTYAERYQAWARTTSRPDLVTNVYVWRASASAESKLLMLVPADNRFVEVEWPASLASLRARVENESPQPPGPPAPELRAFAWTLEQRIPALVRPVLNFSRPRRMQQPRVILGFVIVELNRAAIEHMLGELAQRYFSGPDGFIYNVAVMSGGEPIYRSDPQLTAASLNPKDARTALLPGPEMPPRDPAARLRKGRPRPRGAIIIPSRDEDPWQLVVRHRGGSLEAVVAADRWRNLLLSFGVLLVLAVSMALVIVSAQRARRLARLQLEFVAGVSHELRTPVAVICSAADNLAEGLVGAKDQVKEYGSVIRNEGRRLAGMIEQILHFAAGQSRRASYDLRPVAVSEVVASVLANIAALPEAAGVTMERAIDPDVPAVAADPTALTRCLENLVMNAVKYGGEGRWLLVRAARAGEGRVRIGVEDRGVGIEPADLAHIFEPFYRGKNGQTIHGTGLGLSLARDIAEGMGGRLEASSVPGRGSTFTLELAAAAEKPVPQTV